MANAPPEHERISKRSVFDRFWALSDGLDLLYVGIVVLCAVGWGLFVVANSLLVAWRTDAWWNFTLIAVTSMFILGGTLREFTRRRLGAFSIVVVILAFLLGVAHVFGDGGLFRSNP